MYSLYKGSIFNTKCDLLIVPCNSNGGISKSISNGLKANKIPNINRAIPYGEVYYTEISNNYYNSFVIGYAASVGNFVDGNVGKQEAKIDCVKKIMQSILNYSKENNLQKINIPLLATGAGGLSTIDSFTEITRLAKNESSINLYIYTLDSDKYNLLSSLKNTSQQKQKNPRVFISYTGENYVNAEWVKELADNLRKSGVDARIDIYHLRPGTDLPQWMTDEVLLADKVILICDKYYAQKADFTRDFNGGVGWETMIIQGDMMRQNKAANKYIAIVRETEFGEGMPKYFRTKASLHWKSDANREELFERLLYCIFDCDIAPPIGEVPDFVVKRLSLN